MDDLSVVWLLVTALGVVVLGLAIAYGMKRNGERTRADKKLTEAATHAQYKRDV